MIRSAQSRRQIFILGQLGRQAGRITLRTGALIFEVGALFGVLPHRAQCSRGCLVRVDAPADLARFVFQSALVKLVVRRQIAARRRPSSGALLEGLDGAERATPNAAFAASWGRVHDGRVVYAGGTPNGRRPGSMPDGHLGESDLLRGPNDHQSSKPPLKSFRSSVKAPSPTSARPRRPHRSRRSDRCYPLPRAAPACAFSGGSGPGPSYPRSRQLP